MLASKQMQAAAHRNGSSTLFTTEMLSVRLASDPPGVVEAGGYPGPGIVIHLGSSVEIACRRGGQSHRGLAVHGDIDIVPPGVPSRWEVKQKDTALVIGVHSKLLRRVTEERGLDFRSIEILNRFQMRDPQIEHIGWALKAEMEERPASDRLYTDSLATALAARLVERHSSVAPLKEDKATMSGRRLRLVLAYIEDNLTRDLSLRELASLARMGMSQFKKAFRGSLGLPVHQYVIQRRVERAKILLRESNLPVGQIASEAGFAHQSHLARYLRRMTGVSPKQLRQDFDRE
jgi:AraC family transcriptional regulator